MVQNGFKISQFQPKGVLDMDSGIRDIKPGNYIDAIDIQHLGESINQNEFVYNLNGNLLSFVLPTIASQNKTYQITISVPPSGSNVYEIQVLNANGTSFHNTTLNSSFTVNSGSVLATVTAAWAAQIISDLSIGGVTGCTTTFNGSTGQIFITLTSLVGFVGFDWILNDIGAQKTNPTITQEAVPQNLAGQCFPIGGIDFLGDLFVLSSSQQKASQTFAITAVTTPGGTTTFSVASNLTGIVSAGDEIELSGITGLSVDYTGNWLVATISYGATTTFTIFPDTSSPTGAYTGGGSLITNPTGYLAISVNQFVSPNTWTSTVLLQTRSLNNRTFNLLTGIQADKSNNILTLYFTDNVDVPRAWSYSGPYLTNGSIQPIVSTGIYFYDSLSLQTSLFEQNATSTISLVQVNDTAGNVQAGNWKYAVRFKDASQTTGYPSLLHGPVSIFSASTSQPNTVMGDTSGTPTTKSVLLQINDIPVNSFPYLELIGVQSVNGAEVAYLIKTVSIPTGGASLQITHTGFETYVTFDIGLLDQQGATYSTVKTMEIVSNTLVVANLTQPQIDDLTAWAKTFKHTIVKGTGQLLPTQNVGNFEVGDYQDNNAIFNYIGYTDNETYRFAAVLELLNGSRTSAFWIDDIRMDNFDNSTPVPFNQANPFNDNRRIASFSSYDLSNLVPTNTPSNNSYVTYVEFSNIDFTYNINGQPISSFAKRLHIFRIDNLNTNLNEVLGCGVSVRHVIDQFNDGLPSDGNLYGNINGGGYDPTNNPNIIFDNPALFTWFGQTFDPSFSSVLSVLFSTSTLNQNPYSYGAWNGSGTTPVYTNFLTGCSFHCPDITFGQVNISPEVTDELINYGQPDFRTGSGLTNADIFYTDLFDNGNVCKSNRPSVFIRMSGVTGQSLEPNHLSMATIPVFVDTFSGLNDFFTGKRYATCTDGEFDYRQDTTKHLILHLGSNILQVNSGMWNGAPNGSPHAGSYDIGVYYMQYYRKKGGTGGSANAYNTGISKFGAINTGTYIPTRCYIDVTNSTNNSINVFGGDTFTQKTFYKLRYPQIGTTDPGGYATGSGVCIAFFCQNHFNWNMRNHTVPATMMNYPYSMGLGSWLNNCTINLDDEIYDTGYTPQDNENAIPSFNSVLQVSTIESTRIAWSGVKAQDSLTDPYRQFLPLNIYDLSPDAGGIYKIVNIQGELFSLQPKAFMREFYNETGSINVGESGTNTEVILGSGAPMTKPPQLISVHGCSNLFSVIQGTGIEGEDAVAWVDIINKTIMLFDGELHDIGLEKGIRSFLLNNLTFITGDSPTARNGITGVFDPKRKEFIWTFMGYNNLIPIWNIVNFYPAGVYVIDNNTTTLEGLPTIYQAISSNVGLSPHLNPSFWKLQPYTNSSVYNCFTLVYSLIKGGFTSFYTPKPYIYFQWTNTYLSAYPNYTYNGIYLHDIGAPSTWYVNGGSSQTANAYITYAVNDYPATGKRYMATWFDTLNVPYRLDFTTNVPSVNIGATGNQQSFLLSSDFSNRLNYWQSVVKRDSNTIGVNNTATSQIWGDYMLSTLSFNIGVTQQLFSVFTKFIPIDRLPNN